MLGVPSASKNDKRTFGEMLYKEELTKVHSELHRGVVQGVNIIPQSPWGGNPAFAEEDNSAAVMGAPTLAIQKSCLSPSVPLCQCGVAGVSFAKAVPICFMLLTLLSLAEGGWQEAASSGKGNRITCTAPSASDGRAVPARVVLCWSPKGCSKVSELFDLGIP